jgi:uncharacterized membrane protein YdjX (TVP38/TMEM64 family)
MVRMKPLIKVGILLALIAAAVYFFRFTQTGQAITPRSARAYFQHLDPLVARLVYVLVYIVGCVLLLPGVVLSFAGAILFGPWEGTLYTWMGANVGALLAFYLARWLGRDFVDQLLAGRFGALNERIRRHGFRGLLILRLVPLFPFNGVNFGSGLTGIRVRDYILATAIGIVPATFVYQYLFATLGDKILDEGFKLEYLWDPTLGVTLLTFLMFIVLGKWLAARLQKPTSSPTPGGDSSSLQG